MAKAKRREVSTITWLKEIGDFLKKVRRENGDLSIGDIANAVSTDRSVLFRFEEGKNAIRMDTLRGLVVGYKMTPEQQTKFATMVMGIHVDCSYLNAGPPKPHKEIIFEILKLSPEDRKKLMEELDFACEIKDFCSKQ